MDTGTCFGRLCFVSSIKNTGRFQRLVIHYRTTSASAAPGASRRMCCPTHCASSCAPCQPLLRESSGRFQSRPSPACENRIRALRSTNVHRRGVVVQHRHICAIAGYEPFVRTFVLCVSTGCESPHQWNQYVSTGVRTSSVGGWWSRIEICVCVCVRGRESVCQRVCVCVRERE